MTERGVWNVEQLELEYHIRQLCKSAEPSELDGVKASKFPIDDVSYYPSPRDESYWAREFRYAIARNLEYNPERPLAHTNTEGDAIIFKKGDLWLVQMDVKSVDPKNRFGIHRIPKEALSPNVHEIRGFSPGGVFGHIYTTDKQGSSWSIHVNKPFDVVRRTPNRVVPTQGVLL